MGRLPNRVRFKVTTRVNRAQHRVTQEYAGVTKIDMILPANPLANYYVHKAEVDNAISAAMSSGFYILGKEVATFEAEFASYLGVSDSVGVGSGTEALHLALRACG